MADDLAASAATASETKASPERMAAEAGRRRQRRRLFTLLGGAVAIVLVLFGVWWLLVASHYVSTDDAYVGAEVAQVTPLVGGAVKAVHVAETQSVKAGDVLVELDPADATLAAQRAEAEYQGALRKIRGDVATAGALSAQVSARAADLAHAQADVEVMVAGVAKAKLDFDRRQALAGTGAVSGEELTAAKTAYENAQSNLRAAQAAATQAEAGRKAAESQLAAQQAMVEGALDANPQVAAARAARDAAQLDLQRTVIRAPVDGVVSKRQVELGQRVAVGSPLMSIVPTSQVYVDANFKEVQLRKVRVGEPATLESDLYGGGVVYHGQVVGIGGGTGSAFALIPAQNATGNWIKVVQRLPVRIRLEPDELAKRPLRLGLSMKAKIDVSGSGRAPAGG
jgi:membrane fusion protein (multidrug efflux system)